MDLTDLPSSAKLETMRLQLRGVSLQLPATAVFASIVDLSLENIELVADSVHLLSRLLSSACCPSLQRLELKKLGFPQLKDLLIEASALLELSMSIRTDLGPTTLKLKTPSLWILHFQDFTCLETLGVSAPKLEELTFLPLQPYREKLILSGSKRLREEIKDNGQKKRRGMPQLSDKVLARIFSYLPIRDIFRIGFVLSKSWFQVWKSIPLVLHDVQLLPESAKKELVMGTRTRFDMADQVTSILKIHPGPIYYFRLEYSTWKGGCTQLRLWIEKLIMKNVEELALFGRWAQKEMDILPNNLIHCSDLRKLTLCFFKILYISQMDDKIEFTNLEELVLLDCELNNEDLSIVLSECKRLQKISLEHVSNPRIFITSQSLCVLRLLYCKIPKLYIMDCPELHLFAQAIEDDCMLETQINIHGSPNIEVIQHLYLDQQTINIDYHQIELKMEDHPRYLALTKLSIGVRFYRNCRVEIISELLTCFPNLVKLIISRMDPEKPYSTETKWKSLLESVSCIKTLQWFELRNSGLSDTEVELAECILMYAANLEVFVLTCPEATPIEAVLQMEQAIDRTKRASVSLRIDLHFE